MRIFAAAIACALLAVSATDSLGQSGQSKAPATSQVGNTQSTAPNPLPIVVNVLPPTKTDAELEQERTDRTEKSNLDRRLVDLTSELAKFTGWLAYATIALVAATAGLVIMGVKQASDTKTSLGLAEKAAIAADLSARAAISLELPIIRMKPENISSGDVRDGDGIRAFYSVSGIVFTNSGRTRATPVEIRYGMTNGEFLPPKPIYTTTETFLPTLSFDPPEADRYVTPRKSLENCSAPLQTGDSDLFYQGTKGLWLYCELVYLDFMDSRHTKALCWRWQNVGMGMAWRPDTTPEYNRRTYQPANSTKIAAF